MVCYNVTCTDRKIVDTPMITASWISALTSHNQHRLLARGSLTSRSPRTSGRSIQSAIERTTSTRQPTEQANNAGVRSGADQPLTGRLSPHRISCSWAVNRLLTGNPMISMALRSDSQAQAYLLRRRTMNQGVSRHRQPSDINTVFPQWSPIGPTARAGALSRWVLKAVRKAPPTAPTPEKNMMSVRGLVCV